MRTIRFCSVVFGIMLSLAVIHTIHNAQQLVDHAWSSNTRRKQKAGRKVRNANYGKVQQLLIARPDNR